VIYIYFVQAGEAGPIKIGCSKNPHQRHQDLQVYHYETLYLLGYIEHSDILENQLHQLFEHDRIRGEWFRPTPAVVDKIILLVGTITRQARPKKRLANYDKWPKQPPRPVSDLNKTIDQLTGSTLVDSKDHDNQGRLDIANALKQTGGNISKAADLLHIARRTLQDRMRRYGLPRGQSGHPIRRLTLP